MPDLAAVGLLHQPGIADHQHATVGFRADQSPRALLERDHGVRQLMHGERAQALLLQDFHARRQHGVVWRGKRQFVDDDQRERLAAHVDAFPEALAAHQHGIAELAEAIQQFGTAGLALDQQGQLQAAFREGLVKQVGGALHCPQRGAQQESAAAGGLDQRQRGLHHGVGELRRLRRRQVARHVEQALGGVVERAGQRQRLVLVQAELGRIVREIALHG